MKTITLLGLTVIALHASVPAAPSQETAGESPRSPRAATAPAPSRSVAAPKLRKSAAPHPRLSLMAAARRAGTTSSTGKGTQGHDDRRAAAQPAIPDHWIRLADCESGEWDRHGTPIPGTATWDIVSPPHYGGLQFTLQSWEWVGGEGLPSDATPAEQVVRAEELQRRQGWGAWPVCSVKVGLREGR